MIGITLAFGFSDEFLKSERGTANHVAIPIPGSTEGPEIPYLVAKSFTIKI